MSFIRTFDPDALRPDRFDYQVLADFESCVAIGARIPAGQRRGGRHVHTCDQLFYVISGQMELEMDGTGYTVPAGSVAFIPAGLPHASWNSSDADEIHLDLMTPPPRPGQPLSAPREPAAQTAREVPGGQPARGYVKSRELLPQLEPAEGFSLTSLADRSTGSEQMSVRLAEGTPGGAGSSWHIHEFDLFYLVLEGTLGVEVAHTRLEAGPLSFLRLPAGIPHRYWNGGTSPERHVAVLVPEPLAGQRADIGVHFALEVSDR
ncbi:MAG TPA: cupin domain-containing protein [Streptosporangiaceae bacterium]